jgi:hypothetical protein
VLLAVYVAARRASWEQLRFYGYNKEYIAHVSNTCCFTQFRFTVHENDISRPVPNNVLY